MEKVRRVLYREGDWFAVPLRGTGYGLGLISRISTKGEILFGYFFEARHLNLPDPRRVLAFRANDALLICMFGDGFLESWRWPVLGRREDWDRLAWPMPLFGRCTDPLGGFPAMAWQVKYPNEDPGREPQLTRIDVEAGRKLPKDGLYGVGAVEIVLTRLLDPHAKVLANPYVEVESSFTSDVLSHFLYFSSDNSATEVAGHLRVKQFNTEILEKPGEWLLLVTTSQPVPPDALDEQIEDLEKEASRLGGTYDGYERRRPTHPTP